MVVTEQHTHFSAGTLSAPVKAGSTPGPGGNKLQLSDSHPEAGPTISPCSVSPKEPLLTPKQHLSSGRHPTWPLVSSGSTLSRQWPRPRFPSRHSLRSETTSASFTVGSHRGVSSTGRDPVLLPAPALLVRWGAWHTVGAYLGPAPLPGRDPPPNTPRAQQVWRVGGARW